MTIAKQIQDTRSNGNPNTLCKKRGIPQKSKSGVKNMQVQQFISTHHEPSELFTIVFF
jgi:hypothetical protein